LGLDKTKETILKTSDSAKLKDKKTTPVLHLVCGKIGSGKSTLAMSLSTNPNSVLISEDIWLSKLYPGQIQAIADYAKCSAQLKDALGDHVVSLLEAGLSVVLDFPANTMEVRNWAKGLIEESAAAHELHFLDIPDKICKSRLRARNAAGEHPFQASDAEFDLISRYFVPPTKDEGFNVILHKN
jgi:predicted kinase